MSDEDLLSMIVIDRKPGQTIHIGDDITIRVVEVTRNGQAVRLEIDAPPYMPIHRQEIMDAIHNPDGFAN